MALSLGRSDAGYEDENPAGRLEWSRHPLYAVGTPVRPDPAYLGSVAYSWFVTTRPELRAMGEQGQMAWFANAGRSGVGAVRSTQLARARGTSREAAKSRDVVLSGVS